MVFVIFLSLVRDFGSCNRMSCVLVSSLVFSLCDVKLLILSFLVLCMRVC